MFVDGQRAEIMCELPMCDWAGIHGPRVEPNASRSSTIAATNFSPRANDEKSCFCIIARHENGFRTYIRTRARGLNGAAKRTCGGSTAEIDWLFKVLPCAREVPSVTTTVLYSMHVESSLATTYANIPYGMRSLVSNFRICRLFWPTFTTFSVMMMSNFVVCSFRRGWK